MRCCSLPDACLVILPNNATLQQWRRGINRKTAPAQFRLHVAGLSASALASLQGCLLQIHDPLFPARLRHLERDASCTASECYTGIVHEPRRDAMLRRLALPSSPLNLTMLWPAWENGYGDVIAQTLLPLGEMARLGTLPRALAVSGMEASSLTAQLLAIAPSACAFERAAPAAALRRCESRCYAAVEACTVSHAATREAWEAMAALDTAAGWRERRREAAAFAEERRGARGARGGGGAAVRVLLAAREPHGTHSRAVRNQAELVRACDGSAVDAPRRRWRLECRLLPAGANVTRQVELLQWADVYVTVWGGDTINALHMRRGGVVIEMVPEIFARDGPKPWVGQHGDWITRSRQSHFGRLRHYSMPIPSNATVVSAQVRRCEEQRAERRQKALDGKSGVRRSSRRSAPAPLELNPALFSWECIWNADLWLEWSWLHNALQRALAGVFASGAREGRTRLGKSRQTADEEVGT
ncbi:hypothetical protein AB1Y20_005365 [Prymnesium parvum]|uniref:Uncharacterized protein n=1 Tax=Prymnesium parvum TaxID=97485 RepID=A0AB34J613_PRYPA